MDELTQQFIFALAPIAMGMVVVFLIVSLLQKKLRGKVMGQNIVLIAWIAVILLSLSAGSLFYLLFLS